MLSLFQSCNDESDDGRIAVEIVSTGIPKTAAINFPHEIPVEAQAPNGCYSDLLITLTRLDVYSYRLAATGYYNGGNVCPSVIVTARDTLLFTPEQSGEYYIQVQRAPGNIITDTLWVD